MQRKWVWVAYLVIVSAAHAEFIIESRSGGQNYNLFRTTGGWLTSTVLVPAPGCTATGSMYSMTTNYWGPSRQAVYSFTPTVSGLHNIELAWPDRGGQKDTAVVLYTGASFGADQDPWGNAGPGGVVARTTMDMFYNGYADWHYAFTDVPLVAGTTYQLGIYGGHQTVWEGDYAPNRVHTGAARFSLPEPTSVVLLGVAAVSRLARRGRNAR